MSKKFLSYIACVSFAILTIFRLFNILKLGYELPYIGITAAFAVFSYYNYNDEYKSRGLFLGSTIYLLANCMYMLRPSIITDYICFAGVVLTFVIFYRLYSDDRRLLHQLWFLPSLLVFISFLILDIYNFSFNLVNLIKYLEPIGLFFMCLDVKEWY